MFAIDTDQTPGRPRNNPPSSDESGQRSRRIRYVIGFARRRYLMILACGLLGLCLAAGLALKTHNRYSATAQLLIDPRDLRVLNNEIGPREIGSDSIVAFLESQARLISSDSIKRRVIERLNLAGDPDFGGANDGLLAHLGFSNARSRGDRDPVIEALSVMDKNVIVRRSERTFVIDVTVITGDGDKSARVANALTEAYLEDQTRTRSDAAQRASNSLTSRLAELRERVRLAEDKVETYRARNNLVGVSGKLVTEEQLSLASTQLSQARARATDAQTRWEQVRNVRPQSLESGASPEAISSQAIANLRSQLGSALTREADAQVLYGPQHPIYVSAQAQVRDARRQIAEELARIQQAARAEFERARSTEQSLAAQVERLKQDTLATGAAGVQLRELEREADAHRQVFQAFLVRSRETGEQSGVDTTNARVITTAVAPLEKLGPNRKVFAIIGLLAGIGVGVGLGLLLDAVVMLRNGGHFATVTPERAAAADGDRRSAARTRAKDHNGTSPAGAQTAAPGDAPGKRASRWSSGLSSGLAPGAVRPDGGEAPTVILPTVKTARWSSKSARDSSAFHGAGLATDAFDEPNSAFARAVRQVRDRLVIEEKPGQNRKVAVIGLQPGTGASLVALNLALAAARENATSILIDMATGPASLTSLFAADAATGAEEVMAGSVGLIRAALKDEETGVFFLPRPIGAQRNSVPDPARLSDNLLQQTRRFESVLIDAGSITDGAMPFVLADLVDDIVVVAPAGMQGDAARRLMQRSLAGLSGKVRVIVSNEAIA